jgi:hypothetical protein
METSSKDKLPIGRAAFAKALCAEWIGEHSKTILLAFVTLIVFSFCLYHMMGNLFSGKKADFLKVKNAWEAFSSAQESDPHLLKSLEKPIDRHPELEAQFGNSMAQRLLGWGEVKKAGRYVRASLKRTHDLSSPYYERFSRNTLAISQGQYRSALEEAKRLKLDLEDDDTFWEEREKAARSGVILYAYNLVRIAALERELGSKEGELKAWEDLVCWAGWKGGAAPAKRYDPEASAFLTQNFTQGDVSLVDYIEQRKKELTP